MYKISTLTALLLISVSSGVVQAESKFTLGAGVGVVETTPLQKITILIFILFRLSTMRVHISGSVD